MNENEFPILFSIIIPTKDRLNLLQQCLNSVSAQKYLNFEVIVVDDNSIDGTWEWLDKRSGDRFIVLKNKFGGRSNGRNIGKEFANGEFICFIDDDDYVSTNFLSDFYEGLKIYDFRNNIILRTHFVYDRDGVFSDSKSSYDANKYGSGVNFALYEFCSSCSVCLSKNLSVKEDFPIDVDNWEDSHFLLRILAYGDLIQLPSYNYFYRIHDKMGSKLVMDKNILVENCIKHVGYMDNFFLLYGGRNPQIFTLDAKNKITSEKFAEYAVNAMGLKEYKQAIKLILKSFNRGIYLRNLKHYGMFVINFFKF